TAVTLTLLLAEFELLGAFGSPTEDTTLTWFVIVPAAGGRTLISTPAPCPFVIVPSAQVTVPLDSEQVPCEGVAESKLTPAGNVSVAETPAALEGPELPMSSV